MAAAIVATLRYLAEQKGATWASRSRRPRRPTGWPGFQDRNLIDPSTSRLWRSPIVSACSTIRPRGGCLPKLGITHQELLGMLDRAFVEPLVSKTASRRSPRSTPSTPIRSSPRAPKGTLVLLLQQRLNAMTYYCGTPDGKYSNQTRDAVYAFEKYERLKRTGFVDQTGVGRLLGGQRAGARVCG